MYAIPGPLDVFLSTRLGQRRRVVEQEIAKDSSTKNQADQPKSAQRGTKYHSYSANYLRQVVIMVAAAADSYADASAESPSIDALEDEDDDDEELDASASNEYPDGENDNDESYEDADDDRQESRINENWLAPPELLLSRQQPETDYDRSSIRKAIMELYGQDGVLNTNSTRQHTYKR